MARIETRDEAVAAVRGSLVTWGSDIVGALTQGSARIDAAIVAAEAELAQARHQLSAAEAALANASDSARRDRLDHDIRRSEDRLIRVESVVRSLRLSGVQFEALVRKITSATSATVPRAAADLTRRLSNLERYRATGSLVLGSAPGATSRQATATSSSSLLEQFGLSDVAVSDLDTSDNPIQGSFGRGDTTRADYRWAVETWHSVVRPAVERGADRSYFEQRDRDRSAPPRRRSADVFDLFLGTTDRIVVSRRGDGSLDVVNGRHRIEVARELGVVHLPATVHS